MKRILSTIIALIMLLSLAVIPAQADEGDIITEGAFTCVRLRNGSLKLIGYSDDGSGTVNIPSTIDGHQIERIGEYAFDGGKMKTITIPNTVKTIETSAFNDCTEIEKLSIPNDVYFLDGNPFTGCRNLVNISLDPKHPTLQVTTDGALYSKKNKMLLCYPCSKSEQAFTVMTGTLKIGKKAFYGCEQLESISLPNTVTEISDNAFEGCVKLKSITLPESLLSIGKLAFASCIKLTGVTIPRQVSRIEMSTFFNCISLTSVSLPEKLTDIYERAFFGCKSLPEIYLPVNVKNIGDNAFNGCEALANVYIPVTTTQIGEDVFENCSVRLYLHLEEYAFAEIYAKLYDISYTYGNENSFLMEPTPEESTEKSDNE